MGVIVSTMTFFQEEGKVTEEIWLANDNKNCYDCHKAEATEDSWICEICMKFFCFYHTTVIEDNSSDLSIYCQTCYVKHIMLIRING